MIRIKKYTPHVYYNQSRDFQFIGRLYDMVLNSVKTNTDLIYSLPLSENSDSQLLDLMMMTFGFESKHNYNVQQLKALCASFAKVIRNKGNIQAIQDACNALVSAEGINESIYIDSTSEPYTLILYVPQELSDTNLLRDLLDYILPAGMSFRIIKTLKTTLESTTVLEIEDGVKGVQKLASETAVILDKIEREADRTNIPDNKPYDAIGDFVNTTVVSKMSPQGSTFTITPTLTNVTASASNPTIIQKYETATLTFSADSGYSLPETVSVNGATGNWTQATGTLVLSNPTANVTFSISGVQPLTELCFTAEEAGSTVELTVVGSPSIANTAYSYDRQTWFPFTPSETVGTNVITLTNVNDKVYFRNDITANLSFSNYMTFIMSGSISASGNVNSMQIATDFNNLVALTYQYCYKKLFYNCTSLISAPELPAITLSDSCYQEMFSGCTSLTTAPELLANTLSYGCYEKLFYGCTSLINALDLKATTVTNSCYYSMFEGCTSLVAAPALPAMKLTGSCYYSLFKDCTSLTEAPELPATELAANCYNNMFYNCKKLEVAPELPATTLAERCYYGMFYKCTFLSTAPVLPATELADYCYSSMFGQCSILTNPPALPATTLAKNCYDGLFSGCRLLKVVPELPATTLAKSCYDYMFNDCGSLQVSESQTTEAQYEWNIPTIGTFKNTETYDQRYMFNLCKGDRPSGGNNMTGALDDSHTYYTQNPPIEPTTNNKEENK